MGATVVKFRFALANAPTLANISLLNAIRPRNVGYYPAHARSTAIEVANGIDARKVLATQYLAGSTPETSARGFRPRFKRWTDRNPTSRVRRSHRRGIRQVDGEPDPVAVPRWGMIACQNFTGIRNFGACGFTRDGLPSGSIHRGRSTIHVLRIRFNERAHD